MDATGLGLIAVAVSAALVAGAAGWFARGLVADHIEIPAIIEQQDRLCEAATEKAAAEAIAAEQLRQFRIGERAAQRFIEESQAAADDAQARQDVLEMEIRAYEDRLANRAGCTLGVDDLELIGVQSVEPDRPGGR